MMGLRNFRESKRLLIGGCRKQKYGEVEKYMVGEMEERRDKRRNGGKLW